MTDPTDPTSRGVSKRGALIALAGVLAVALAAGVLYSATSDGGRSEQDITDDMLDDMREEMRDDVRSRYHAVDPSLTDDEIEAFELDLAEHDRQVREWNACLETNPTGETCTEADDSLIEDNPWLNPPAGAIWEDN